MGWADDEGDAKAGAKDEPRRRPRRASDEPAESKDAGPRRPQKSENAWGSSSTGKSSTRRDDDSDGEPRRRKRLAGRAKRLRSPVSQRHLAHCFSAVLRPFCAVFPPLFCAVWLPGAETERTGEKWRKMGEIWGRNGEKQRWLSGVGHRP